ncbi:DUF2218 domain-containing protein [Pseudomonas sp. UBA7530]|uniref:DUF2218 domain-containing protein n=1 Tax=Pseudomonas sp. UBA7530 TaxID=1947341 RepID=UPI0018D634A4|nr:MULTISPECIES: DUF2218 domain-containing protein [Pseudomonas]MBH3340212.1 DUF2218 domain-containing protein [Pseudomonas mendocina]
MPNSHSSFTCTQAPRLLGRLCKHFSHKIEARWSEQEGLLRFSIGECVLRADEQALHLACTAPSAAELDELQEVIRRHLQGFAQLDQLVLQWH